MNDFTSGFLTFWAKYPRKVAKLAAFKAWNRLNLKVEDEMRISYYIKVHDWPEGKFIPYPATFLNGHRWEDEETPVRCGGMQLHRELYIEPERWDLRLTVEEEAELDRLKGL